MDKYNIEIEELGERLDWAIYPDVMDVAQYINPSKTLMFISLFDNKVPTKYQKQLRDEIGCKAYFLFSGHYTGFVYLLPPFNFVQRKSLGFFDECFND